jgi:hypothetical protein
MKHIFLFIIVFFIFNLSCNGLLESVTTSPKTPSILPDSTTFYFNSFEADSDLTGWQGISVYDLYGDAPLNGGSKSVYISGGCLIPHAFYTFDPPDRDINMLIEFYGKNLDIGGVVELMIGSNYGKNSVQIQVMDSTWRYYESDSTLLWPADSTMTLMMNSGGYAPSAMLIDCLRLTEVE